jgi:hypothetical protein
MEDIAELERELAEVESHHAAYENSLAGESKSQGGCLHRLDCIGW